MSNAQEDPVCLRYWLAENVLDMTNVKNSYITYKQATKETLLLALQYKIIHNTIPTKKKLKDWKLSDSEICTFCNEAVDTLAHYFWECKIAKEIRIRCVQLLNFEEEFETVMTKLKFLLGFGNKKFDHISLIIKYCIYLIKQKEYPLKDKILEREMSIRIQSDKERMNANDFENKWGVLHNITNNYKTFSNTSPN